MRQKIVCEFCGRVGKKADDCIICGPKFLPPSLRINMNQFNALPGEEPNEPLIQWNRQPPVAHFNDDIEVNSSEIPVEYNSEYVPDRETTPIISTDDDEMDHLL